MNPSLSAFPPVSGSPKLQALFTTLAEEILRLPPGIVCLTGGGGKSTLMYSLGSALAAMGNGGKGSRVLLTTTTRMMRPDPAQCPHFLECRDASEISLPDTPGVTAAARPAGPGQKPEYLRGFSPDEINSVWDGGVADWIFVEADGSACRPLKAPIAKEPVIPEATGAVIAVAGLSGLYKVFSDDWVFRPEAFSAITGLAPGDTLLPEAIAAIFHAPDGLFKASPEKANRLAFFNQADVPGGLEAGVALARAVLEQPGGLSLQGVFAGSARLERAPCLSFALSAG